MKFLETHFREYTGEVERQTLHPAADKWFRHFPEQPSDLKNLIYYGPPGIGKYSQVLHSIQKYSPSKLKYEKKMTIIYDKESYHFKISDIHFEVDMDLLGCNSKLLWHEIYSQIADVIMARPNKWGIILCKQFHHIETELLDLFYTFIQQNQPSPIHITFILLTNHLSFIPDRILNACEIIHFQRPPKTLYAQCTGFNAKQIQFPVNNVKQLKEQIEFSEKKLWDILMEQMIHVETLSFLPFRNSIYDLFIFHVDIGEGIWYLLNELKLTNNTNVLKRLYLFYKYFNNNYRPIYHLESFLFYLINVYHKYGYEHEFGKSN